MNRDRLSAARRSWNMSRIRGKDTTPEKTVRSLLHRLGFRFRVHRRIEVQGPKPKVQSRKAGRARHSVRAASPVSQPSTKNPQLLQRPRPACSRHLMSRRSRTKADPPSPLDPRPLIVTPDIVLPRHRVAIFVHGCFWHRHRGCKNCTTPTHRREWWLKKLEGNAARDKIHQRALRKLGWRVIVIWECKTSLSAKLQSILAKVLKF